MKRWHVVLVAGFVIFLAAVGGPRASIGRPDTGEARARVPADPAALEGWLASRERPFPDLTPGTDKHIRWAGAPGEPTALSIVVLHGFSATRQEIEPVGSRLGDALGANVFWTRLEGHGLGGSALAEATAAGWLEDTAEALEIGRRLGREVLIVGVSTGATLAVVHLSREREPKVRGLVMISPNLGPADDRAELLLLPWMHYGAWLLGERSWEPRNEAQARYWTTSYPARAAVPMMALVRAARDMDPATLDVPVLVIRNAGDPVVSAARTDAWVARVPRHEVVDFVPRDGEDGHVLAGDVTAPSRVDEVVTIIADAARSW